MSEPMVVTIAPTVAARVRDQERFNAAFARASAFRHRTLLSLERKWRAPLLRFTAPVSCTAQ